MADNQLPIIFRYRWGWHLLFWVVIFCTYWLTNAGFMGFYFQELLWSLTLLPVRMIGTYVYIYWILPFATEKKKFAVFGVLTAIHSFLYGLAIWMTYKYTNLFPEMFDFSKLPVWNLLHILNKLVSNYGIPVLASAIVIFKKWYINEVKSKKLTEEKMAAELNFLKSQIHPHFLFNTLNNLYALTLIKSDKTPDMVLKLSDLLDYMIYKSNEDFVPLEKELEVLVSYVELEKMRYNERLDLQFDITGNSSGYQIAPLILLPFVENCFKHGASIDRSSPFIRISVEIGASFLILHAVNSLPKKKIGDGEQGQGIGLAIVRRRLELIYPRQHELDIRQEAETFSVKLIINWNKN